MGAMEQVAVGWHVYGLRMAVKPFYSVLAVFCVGLGGYFLLATPTIRDWRARS